MKYIILMLALLSVLYSYGQQTETVTNQTIIALHKAGLGKEVLISKIQTSPCSFDLSTEGLIALKKERVADEVIAAMLTKTNNPVANNNADNNIYTGIPMPNSSGLYYMDSIENKYVDFDPSILTNQKSGGLGETLKRSVTGLFNAKQRASLSGKEASIKFQQDRPVFLFVFDSTTGGFSNSNSILSTVQSPNEFFLVKLTVNKNSREIVVGKENNVKSDVGIDDELKVSFISKKIKKGVYEVYPSATLSKGEYCFMFAASSMYGGQTHKVYDFGIR